MVNRYRKTFTYEGQRYYVEASSEKELWMKYSNKLRDLEENKINPSRITVETWARKAADTYKANLVPYVRDNFDYRMQHYILDNIGKMRLKDVRPIHCQNCLNQVSGYAKTTIEEVLIILRFIFRTAVENRLISENPAASLKRPPGKPIHIRRAITDQEEKALLEAVKHVTNGDMFLFMLYCGCRPSEARSIKHEDLDLNSQGNPILHIRGTKTENADRVVPCPVFLYNKHHEGSGLLFTNTKGQAYNQTSIRKVNERLYREMDLALGAKTYRRQIIESHLSEDFTPYYLRHTYCTNLAKRGIDIRIAQKLMGHSSIEMTASIYTHIDTKELDFSDFFGA